MNLPLVFSARNRLVRSSRAMAPAAVFWCNPRIVDVNWRVQGCVAVERPAASPAATAQKEFEKV